MNDPNEGIETITSPSLFTIQLKIEMNDPNEGIETHYAPNSLAVLIIL